MKDHFKYFVTFCFHRSLYMIDVMRGYCDGKCDSCGKCKNSTIIKPVDKDKIDFFEEYLINHQFRVAEVCLKAADFLGLSREKTNLLVQCALLHDVGKFFIPEELLMKKGPLTEEEYEDVKKHVELGVFYLEQKHFNEELVKIIKHHHERFDGAGYPDGLSGDRIPYLSRILAVCDAFDAMTCGRHYKKPVNKETAIRELLMSSGSQFDPEIADAFISQFVKKEVV
ncbi:HD-GYP domain-containing protein [Thermoanaerobacterium sp. DL9XJH110]|uniref:HD-GYP domain-containing protein n=1 Tax=Thermoanaerobacterium sp. DL9XJH110 TaxID=3386643 RepID=UPI003BB7A5C6